MKYVKSCIFISMLAGIGYAWCLGDLDQSGGENVLDIVALVNCILEGNCDDYIVLILNQQPCYPADMNGDGNYNILDVVILSNCVLAGNCEELEG